MKRGCVLAVLALCGAAPAAAENKPAPKDIIVDRAQFQCLVENIDKVPSEPRGVFVDFADCRADGIKLRRHFVTPPPRLDPNGVETMLFVRPKTLKCLKSNRKHIDRILRPAGGNRYGLRIDPCGK